jgi:hypothetical protein
MSSKKLQPWQDEAKELIQNSIDQIEKNKREAFLSFDRNVEDLLKKYLKLDSSITGAKTSYTERQKAINGGFHDLISATIAAASDKIATEDMHRIKWYHDIRNGLYHNGHGLTVTDETLFDYAHLAVNLLQSLLDVDLSKELGNQLKKISTEVQNHSHLSGVVKAYTETLKEWVESQDEFNEEKAELADRLLLDFTLPKIKERAFEIVKKATEDYYSGADADYKMIKSKRFKNSANILDEYNREVKELTSLTPKLNNIVLSLDDRTQNFAYMWIAALLPIAARIVTPQEWTYDMKDEKIMLVETLFPELAGNDNREEVLLGLIESFYEFVIEKGKELENLSLQRSKLKSIRKKLDL